MSHARLTYGMADDEGVAIAGVDFLTTKDPDALYIDYDEEAWVEAQRARDDCALKRNWCLVHDEADTMDHHFKVHPNATYD